MTGTKTIGVVGAGTMGSGIALTALLADLSVVLYDISAEMRLKGEAYIHTHLEKKRKAINMKYLHLVDDLSGFSGCDAVIEAAPEDLALKTSLFSRLDEICPPPTLLATNTSTLSVTAIAAATTTPERVVGMHFFNPAPVLPLVEIVRAALTSNQTVTTAIRLVEKMGKVPVITQDTPGFIVNRVARPFYGEALRLLGEGIASVDQIDRLVREGGGFRMGPFELMDLIGIDVNLAATRSIYEQTFFEPRYRPHPIQSQMVAQRTLGRKTGRGYYEYNGEQGKSPVPAAPTPPAAEEAPNPILLIEGQWGSGLHDCLSEKGFILTDDATASPAMAVVAAGKPEGLKEHLQALERSLGPQVLLLSQCLDVTLSEAASWLEHPQRLVGFDSLFFSRGSIATFASLPLTAARARESAQAFAFLAGRHPIWIRETPGLVLPRLIACLANEAAFAAGEGVAEAETIDRAMQLGTNYPKGPLAWAEEIGYAQIVAILDHLHAEYGEERYRVAPRLRQWARLSTRIDGV